MKRIALFTPLSPVRSALVDHIEGLLPHLATRYDLVLVTNGGYTPEPPLSASGQTIPCITVKAYEQMADAFDLVIYQLGDEANIHGYMFDMLHRRPGLVFLHDLVLHHAIVELTLNRGDVSAYLTEMRYAYGVEGETAARQVIAGQETEGVFTTYPLCERVADSSMAVVGFNGYMCDQITERRPQALTYCARYPFYMPCEPSPEERNSPQQHKGPVIASFGLFNSQKRLDLALSAFAATSQLHPNAIYRLVGAPQNDPELTNRIAAKGLTGRVLPSGWLDRSAFCREMEHVDIALQLRYPHVGGTPYTPIRLLGLGVPTIISHIEPLAEIPADAVIRIPPNTAEEEGMVVAALDYFIKNPDVAQAMAQRGQAFIAERHNLNAVIEQMVAIIDDVIARKPELASRVRTRRAPALLKDDSDSALLVRVAGAALSELGVPTQDRDLCSLAARAIADLSADPMPRRK